MKKVYLTGITGTVAPYIKEALLLNGFIVNDKHIRINKNEDILNLKSYLELIEPDLIIHAALGPLEVVEMFATYAKANNIGFIYISTVSVYQDNEGGPYYIEDEIKVKNEYGLYKYNGEQRALAINPNAHIIRLGWQISPIADSTTNNMFKFIKDNTDQQNNINVSDEFYPSVSFLDETAAAIIKIINKPAGLYLVNGNHQYSLFEIISILKKKFNLDINVVKDNTFKRNDIMIDNRIKVNLF
jgi:dTDP-4-dehydrorhamnose reductase